MPTISSISPAAGPDEGGTRVTITGTGFSAGTPVVDFSGLLATNVVVNSDTELECDVPWEMAISPTQGLSSGGTAFSVTGPGLAGFNSGAGDTITIGGTAATSLAVVSATEVTGVAPAGTAGDQNLVATVSGSTNTLQNGFTYITLALTSISPTSGDEAGGTTVTATGTFDTGQAISFTVGGVAATSPTVVNATTATFVTPAGTGASNDVAATQGAQSDTLAGAFEYTSAAWTPADITTALWLDADDGSTITLDGSSNVEQWDDKSGNARHVNNSTASDRPSSTAAGPEFDGTEKLNMNTGTNLMSGGGLMVAVWTPTQDTAYMGSVCEEAALDVTDFANRITITSDTRSSPKRLVNNGSDSWIDLPAKESPNLPKLALHHNDGTTITGRLFGSVVGTTSLGIPADDTRITIGMQERADIGNVGKIHEVVWMSDVPSTSDIESLEGYLAHKWDVILGTTELVDRLPAAHPYKSSPP